jgi:hypothetical protein
VAPLGAYVGTPVLVGILSLLMVGLTVFDNPADRGADGPAV